MVEDVADGVVFRGGGGREIAAAQGVDVAALEPAGGGAEDEVHRALDIAVLEVFATVGIAGVDGVLEAQETAVAESCAVSLDVQGDGLRHAGIVAAVFEPAGVEVGHGVVADGDVLADEIRAVHPQGVAQEGADRAARGRRGGDVAVVVPDDDGGVAVFAD